MKRQSWMTVFFCLMFATQARGQSPVQLSAEAPELEERAKDQWINSKPLKLADLKGHVVVLHFWTFGCINCIHNQPQNPRTRKGYVTSCR